MLGLYHLRAEEQAAESEKDAEVQVHEVPVSPDPFSEPSDPDEYALDNDQQSAIHTDGEETVIRNNGPTDHFDAEHVKKDDLDSLVAQSPIVVRGGLPSEPTSRVVTLATVDDPSPRRLEWPGHDEPTSMALTLRVESQLETYAQRVRPRMAAYTSLPGPIQDVSTEKVLTLIDDLRLRSMPPQGSRLDKILYRAEGFIQNLSKFLAVIEAIDPNAPDCSGILITGMRHLIQQSSIDATLAAEKIFTLLDQTGTALDRMEQQVDVVRESTIIREILVQAFITIMDLTLDAIKVLKITMPGNLSGDPLLGINSRFEPYIRRLRDLEAEFAAEVWRRMILASSTSTPGIDIDRIRTWLAGHEESVRIEFQGFAWVGLPDDELPLKWLSDLTRQFWSGENSLLNITGGAGCGKSGLVGSVLDRSRSSYSSGTRLLYYNADPAPGTHRTSKNLIKSLLLQFLDRSVGNNDLLSALGDAYTKIERNGFSDGENLFWSILRDFTMKQPSEMLIVIDGLDKIEGGIGVALNLRAKLREVVSQRGNLRCIILSRPIFEEPLSGCFDFPLGPGTIAQDIRHFLEQSIRRSVKLTFLTKTEMESVTRRTMERSIGTFLEANLLIAYMELLRSYEEIMGALKSVPKTAFGLVDELILRVDFKAAHIMNIMSWLSVSQRHVAFTELEMITDANFAPGGFGPHPEQSLRSSCASLVEMRGTMVQFIHPSIRDRLLALGAQSRIPLNANTAHRHALLRCLEYIKRHLQDYDDKVPVLIDADREINRQVRDHITNDSLLEYCIRFYIVHYDKSKLNHDDEAIMKTSYVDSLLLARCERYYWRLQASGKALEQLHRQALHLRKSIFGKQSRSIIQNLVTLAILCLSSGNSASALYPLSESWEMACKVFGDNAIICRELARKYSDVFFSQSKGELGLDQSVEMERLFEYLWVIEQEQYGSVDERATKYVELLVSLYIRRGRQKDAARLLRQLYQAGLAGFGKFDARTVGWADMLIDVLTRLGQHREIRGLCEGLFEGTPPSLEVWDQRRLAILFRLVESYIQDGQLNLAQERLKSSWHAFYELVEAQSVADAGRAFVDITIQLVKLLDRCNQRDEALEIVTKMWTIVEARTPFNDSIMVRLRVLSEQCMELGLYEVVLPILLRLRTAYADRPTDSLGDAIRVAVCLSKCYRHKRTLEDGYSLLEELLDIVLAMANLDESAGDLAAEFISLCEVQSKWEEANTVCRRLLARVWPALIEYSTSVTGVPDQQRGCAIKSAFLHADLMLKQEKFADASRICRFIYTSSLQSLSIDDISLFHAAQRLSHCLQKLELFRESVQMWRSLHAACVERLGVRHPQSIRVTQDLLSVCRGHTSNDVSEDLLVQIIESFGSGVVLCEQPCSDAVLTLIAIYETQGALAQVRQWYQRLWSSVKGHHHSGSVSNEQVFSIFKAYSRFFITSRQRLAAINLARELRALLQLEPDKISIWSIRVDFELAKLLETDETRYKEAVGIYEEICQIYLDDLGDREAILAIIHAATNNLAILYSGHSDLADKAETLLIDVWVASKRTKGNSDNSTYICFQQLMEFYRKQGATRTTVALQRLGEYVVDLLVEERNEKRLFELAGSFAKFYRDFQSVQAGLKLTQDLRAELASLDGQLKGVTRLGRSKALLVDRRSFVFIYAVEELLLGKSRPTLFNDILQNLVTETALYEAWSKVNRIPCPLRSKLSAGSRLMIFLEGRGRRLESQVVRNEIWIIFQDQTISNLPRNGSMWRLFEVCVSELGKPRSSISVIRALSDACIDLYRRENFSICLRFMEWVSEYFTLEQSWFSSTTISSLGFELAQGLSATTHSSYGADVTVIEKIQQLVSETMIGALQRGGSRDVAFGHVSAGQINILIRILGTRNDLPTLERIFQSLWDSRTSHKWGASTTVAIGCRLCEVKFARSHQPQAISLIEDICYNLRDVYGPLHALTVQCENLRARFLNSQGQYDNSSRIHADLIQETLRGRQHDDSITALILEQSRLFKAAFALSGGWSENANRDQYLGLMNEAFDEYLGENEHGQEVGRASTWQPVCGLNKPDVIGYELEFGRQIEPELDNAKDLGCWKAPDDWTLTEEGEMEDIENHEA